MKTIASRQHPIVRAFRDLAAEPDPAGARLLLDGAHQVREARDAGVELDAIAVARSRLDTSTEEGDLARTLEHDGIETYAVSDHVLSAISPVRTPSGIAAIGRRTPVNASAICRRDNAFTLIAVNVQDPGNLGALIRALRGRGLFQSLAEPNLIAYNNQEASFLAETLKDAFGADKMNVATLGNVVSQLHMHVIIRRRNDAAWPAPVWGRHPAVPYSTEQVAAIRDRLRLVLTDDFRFVEQ